MDDASQPLGIPTAGEVSEAVALYRKGLQIMDGCGEFLDDDPTMETVRTDLAELLNMLEKWVYEIEGWVVTCAQALAIFMNSSAKKIYGVDIGVGLSNIYLQEWWSRGTMGGESAGKRANSGT